MHSHRGRGARYVRRLGSSTDDGVCDQITPPIAPRGPAWAERARSVSEWQIAVDYAVTRRDRAAWWSAWRASQCRPPVGSGRVAAVVVVVSLARPACRSLGAPWCRRRRYVRPVVHHGGEWRVSQCGTRLACHRGPSHQVGLGARRWRWRCPTHVPARLRTATIPPYSAPLAPGPVDEVLSDALRVTKGRGRPSQTTQKARQGSRSACVEAYRGSAVGGTEQGGLAAPGAQATHLTARRAVLPTWRAVAVNSSSSTRTLPRSLGSRHATAQRRPWA